MARDDEFGDERYARALNEIARQRALARAHARHRRRRRVLHDFAFVAITLSIIAEIDQHLDVEWHVLGVDVVDVVALVIASLVALLWREWASSHPLRKPRSVSADQRERRRSARQAQRDQRVAS